MKRESTKGEAIGLVLVDLEVHEVRITAHAAPSSANVAALAIEGLDDAAKRETRIRIRSCIDFEDRHVAVNVEGAPRGASTGPLDLAIAAAVLRALRAASPIQVASDAAIVGELGLDGRVRAVRGAAVMAEKCHRPLVLPHENEWEVSLTARATRADISTPRTVQHLIDLSDGRAMRTVTAREPVAALSAPKTDDWIKPADRAPLVERARAAKRALLIGPPGAGKTMFARMVGHGRALDAEAFREVLSVYSAAGVAGASFNRSLPFRAPHHTVSETALAGGGGSVRRPGEVSLAHRGVLFLDELSEFRRSAIECLAVALRDRKAVGFPAAPDFLIAAVNPCPCGRASSGGTRACTCSPAALRSHTERIDRYAALLGITERITLAPIRVEDLGVKT